MNSWAITLLKIYRGMFYVLASLYCFLAFIPFTNLFLIANPPYRAMVTLVHYNVLLIWIAFVIAVLWQWPSKNRGLTQTMLAAEFCLAVAVSIHSPIAHVQNDATALFWGIFFLLFPLATASFDLSQKISAAREQDHYSSIAYSDAVYIGLLAGLLSIAGPRLWAAAHGGFLLIQRHDAVLMFWVLIEHVTLAVCLTSVVNLTRLLLFRRNRNELLMGPGVIAVVTFFALAFGCLTFIQDSLSLQEWPAWLYATLLAATISLCGLTIPAKSSLDEQRKNNRQWAQITFAVILMAFAIFMSLAIDANDDWNGILHKTLALLVCATIAFIIRRLRSAQAQYRIATVLAVALATFGIYETLNYSKPVWATAVGVNKSEILREFTNYTAQNSSLEIVDTLLGNRKGDSCDTGCKILRQYSNIRNAKIERELTLVDHMEPCRGPRPNIFIIVIDSLRPDYLGAYNPRVDFTPNIDAFARDSTVMRRAYSDYAGTSLSEPSIWSGALLLHAHYAQPFTKANSLAKLAKADGYQTVVSYDAILREIIPSSDDLIKLDTDKKTWGQIEISSTIEQLGSFLDQRPAGAAPVLFYTQAMNVQIHADNNLPKRTNDNWKSRAGFDDRIAYTLHQADESLGRFFQYLKSKNLYEDSVVIITADHGDATGELGRRSHSTIIYPEVMRVPLIIHLPQSMRGKYVYDENQVSSLIDIAPSLYYLLGHRAIKPSPVTGRPIFLEHAEESANYPRNDLFLASDSLAAYGILAGDGRWMYTTYDSPARSMLFDLEKDPTAQHSVLTPEIKAQYDERILQYLQSLSKVYGHRATGG